MSSSVLSVFDDYNNQFYTGELSQAVLEKIDIHRKKSHLTAVIYSSRLISFEALEDFSLYLSEKYPDFSIDITNRFDFATFRGQDMPVLLRHYCTNVMYIPLNFFNDASVWMEDNIFDLSLLLFQL